MSAARDRSAYKPVRYGLLMLALALPAGASFAQNQPPPAQNQPPPAFRGFGPRPPVPPPSGRAGAEALHVDFTGYWTSVVNEDWRWRMATPLKGDFANIPLNVEGEAIGERWDPAADEAAGEQCKAYAAPGVMRLPEHLHIFWQDDRTLVMQIDAGMQTRVLHFGAPPADMGKPDWQGYSVARWEGPVPAAYPGAGLGLDRRGDTRSKSLEVMTTNLQPGYLRKNGIPFSAKTRITEYYDRYRNPDGSEWFDVTTIVEDPVYLTAPWVTSSDFQRLTDGSRWHPAPCVAR
jgi:hypothetical protein